MKNSSRPLVIAASMLCLTAGCVGKCLFRGLENGHAAPSPAGMSADPRWQGPPPTPANRPFFPEQIALLSQQLAAAEDDKKVLVARIRQMDETVKEKAKAIAQASSEIQIATDQIKSSRAEFLRWKQEMENLRTRLQNVERENKVTLETIIHTLEQFLEKEGASSLDNFGLAPAK